MPKQFLAKREEFIDGQSRAFVVDGKRVLVVASNGTLTAYKNFCPHMGGTLRFNGCEIKCDWHGALFDLSSGEPKTAPALQSGPLEPVSLSVEDDDVLCELVEPKSSPWADDF